MSSLIIFDPNQTPSPVLSYTPSNVDPAAYVGHADALLDADLSQVKGVSQLYWKVVAGAVVPMTTQEQAAVNAALVASAIAQMRSDGQNQLAAGDGVGILERAFASIVVDENNILRAFASSLLTAILAATSLADLKTWALGQSTMAPRTLAQLRTAIISKITGGTVDS